MYMTCPSLRYQVASGFLIGAIHFRPALCIKWKRTNVATSLAEDLLLRFNFASATPCYYRMETSAARKLTLVFLLLAVWGCQSMQHSVESVRRSLRSLRSPRAQEGANMDSMQYSREADSDSSDAAVNTGVQNLTVPHFLLHELYLHLEKPIDHTYSDVNSILSFENQANASESLLHFMYCQVLRVCILYFYQQLLTVQHVLGQWNGNGFFILRVST